MKTQEHTEKAERFERSARKIPKESYEMLIWNRMHAGTNYLNAVLHKLGITPEGWDLIHTDFPLQKYDLEELSEGEPDGSLIRFRTEGSMREAMDALDIIERLRSSHIRGPGPYGEMVTARALEAYEGLREFCLKTLSG